MIGRRHQFFCQHPPHLNRPVFNNRLIMENLRKTFSAGISAITAITAGFSI